MGVVALPRGPRIAPSIQAYPCVKHEYAMEVHLRKLWDSLRSSYWFVPALMTIAAVLLWAGTSVLDQTLYAARVLPSSWLYSDDIGAVRTLLLAVAGAIIGLVGVVFS